MLSALDETCPSPERRMRRRQFITMLGGAAAAWPLAVRAQQAGVPTIGYLGSALLPNSQRDVAFFQRLRELGWIEGRNIAIAYRWGENRVERYTEIAAEFVQLKVDIIVTFGTAVPAFKQATSSIPIVFTIDADPVGRGLVASLARPGGNVTGLSNQSIDLPGKRIEMLREAIPGLRRLAVLANAGFPGAVQEMGEVLALGRKLGLEVATLQVRAPADIEPGLETFKGQAEALYVCGDALIFSNRLRISTLAIGARLPTIYGSREYVDLGGFASYGPHFADLWRRAAGYVDAILRGAKPANIPVEQPTKFELVVNLTTAKALGLKIPEAFLLRADEVIE
jgi:putative ABC transport system substrate-binding protein